MGRGARHAQQGLLGAPESRQGAFVHAVTHPIELIEDHHIRVDARHVAIEFRAA